MVTTPGIYNAGLSMMNLEKHSCVKIMIEMYTNLSVWIL